MALTKKMEGLAPSIIETARKRGNVSRGNVRSLFPIHARLAVVVDALPCWQLVREFLRIALLHADPRGFLWTYLRTLAGASRKSGGRSYSYETFRRARRVCRDLGLWQTVERIAPGGYYPTRLRGELVHQGGEPSGDAGGAVSRVNIELLRELGAAIQATGIVIVGPFVVGYESIRHGRATVRTVHLRATLEKTGWRAPPANEQREASGKPRGNLLPRGGVMGSPSSELGSSPSEKNKKKPRSAGAREEASPASPAKKSHELGARADAGAYVSPSRARGAPHESRERTRASHEPRPMTRLLAEDAEARAKLDELLLLLRGSRVRSGP